MRKFGYDYKRGYIDGNTDGYKRGYNNGYEDGLRDGNPFNAIADAVSDAVAIVADTLRNMDYDQLQRLLEEGNKVDNKTNG